MNRLNILLTVSAILMILGCTQSVTVLCDGMTAPQNAIYSETVGGSYVVFLIEGDKLIKAHIPVDRCVVIESK